MVDIYELIYIPDDQIDTKNTFIILKKSNLPKKIMILMESVVMESDYAIYTSKIFILTNKLETKIADIVEEIAFDTYVVVPTLNKNMILFK